MPGGVVHELPADLLQALAASAAANAAAAPVLLTLLAGMAFMLGRSHPAGADGEA